LVAEWTLRIRGIAVDPGLYVGQVCRKGKITRWTQDSTYFGTFNVTRRDIYKRGK
jgi:hypothetical protein